MVDKEKYSTKYCYPVTSDQIRYISGILGKKQTRLLFEIFQGLFEVAGDFKENANLETDIDFGRGKVTFQFRGSRRIVSGDFASNTLTSDHKVDRKIKEEAEKALNAERGVE